MNGCIPYVHINSLTTVQAISGNLFLLICKIILLLESSLSIIFIAANIHYLKSQDFLLVSAFSIVIIVQISFIICKIILLLISALSIIFIAANIHYLK